MSSGPSAGWYRPELVQEADAQRRATRRRRSRAAIAVPITVTLLWALYVLVSGQGARVARHWPASVTMVFGSFVAGSTPQGGGAVAFPVFTKVLEIPADVARTFSLCIQAIGMGAASAVILITRRLIEWRAILVGGGAAMASFIAALLLLGDGARPFWTPTLPGPYVRVTFSLVLAAMAFVVFLSTRVRIRKIDRALPPLNGRMYAGLVAAGLLGGLAAALVGSGADVLVYLVVVVLLGLDAKVGLPSSVVTMAAVSWLGVIVLGVLDGQLAIGLSADGTIVETVGGLPAAGQAGAAGLVAAHASGEPLPASRFDLFGLWLAAVPIVVWGAPVGSWVASRMRTRHLVYFVACLALLELISTAIFLDALHRPGPLLAYALTGLVVTLGGLYLLARNRRRIFGLPGLDLDQSLSIDQLDVAPGFERQVRPDAHRRRRS